MIAVSISLAAGPQGIHEPGTGLINPEVKEAAQGTGQGLKANATASTPGIHEPGTGITNPEVKEAAQETRQGIQEQAGQPNKEPAPTAQKTQPGFEAIFALTGLIVAAFIVIGKRN